MDPTLLAKVRETRESGKWRRALMDLEAAGRAVIDGDAEGLSLWLMLKCELGEKRDLAPHVRRLLAYPDLTFEQLRGVLPGLPPEVKTALSAEIEGWVAGRSLDAKTIDDFWELMPLERWSADRLFEKIADTQVSHRYDALLAEAKRRFAGDPRIAAVKKRPLSDAEIAAQRRKEAADRRDAERKRQREAASSLDPRMRREEQLERAIEAAPDDDRPWQVYADWLQSQGDPRGELIAVQLALEKEPANAALHDRARELERDLRPGLLGPELAVESEDGVEVTLARGFFRSASVRATESSDIEEALAELLARPAARFLRELCLGVCDTEPDLDYGALLRKLGEFAGRMPLLESLFVGDFDSEQCELSWSHLGDASPLYASFPRLRSLILRAGAMTIGPVQSLAELRRFEVRTGGLTRAILGEVLRAPFPALESLSLWFGDDNYGANCTPADLAPLLAGELTPKLTHLGLQNAEFTDELIEPLAASPLLTRLASVDLSLGCLSAPGVEALLAHRAAFAHLKRLDLSENAVDEDAVERLRGFLPAGEIVLDHQDPDRNDGDHRYPAVGE